MEGVFGREDVFGVFFEGPWRRGLVTASHPEPVSGVDGSVLTMDDYYFTEDDTDDDRDGDGDGDDRPDSAPPVTANAAISDFFVLERARASGVRQRRLERATDDLRQCFEEVADRILTTPELEVRELERQFRPEGAAARVADASALLSVLPIWLDDPRWHGADLEDRRLRVQLTMPLARYVTRLPTYDGPAGGGCAMWSLEYAVGRARSGIRLARVSANKVAH